MCSSPLGGRLPSRLTQKAAGPSTWRARVRGPMKPEGAASWTGGTEGKALACRGATCWADNHVTVGDSRGPPRDEEEEEEIEIAGAGARRSVKANHERENCGSPSCCCLLRRPNARGRFSCPSSSAYPEVKLRPLRFLRFSQICSFLLEKVVW
ncbi:hypothetical protein NL676_026274 [Syzygium grande]|nr:hypothetical protein NL676_026274 [Syzygium grande]